MHILSLKNLHVNIFSHSYGVASLTSGIIQMSLMQGEKGRKSNRTYAVIFDLTPNFFHLCGCKAILAACMRLAARQADNIALATHPQMSKTLCEAKL